MFYNDRNLTQKKGPQTQVLNQSDQKKKEEEEEKFVKFHFDK